jgi:hypothetical protein
MLKDLMLEFALKGTAVDARGLIGELTVIGLIGTTGIRELRGVPLFGAMISDLSDPIALKPP